MSQSVNEPPRSAGPTPLHGAGCTYRGLGRDREVRLNFPAPATCCYKAQPASPIAISHQESFCLTSQHVNCPVFRMAQAGPLPPTIAAPPEKRGRRRIMVAFIGLVGLALIAVALLWLSGRGRSKPPATAAAATVTPVDLFALTLTAAARPSITPTRTPTRTPTATPTVTPSPTATPTTLPTPSATPVIPRLQAVGDSVTVYSLPNIYYPALDTLTGDGWAELVVSGQSGDGWWQVCCIAGQTGWVSPTEADADATDIQIVANPAPQAVVSTSGANIRRGPGVVYPIMDTIRTGDSVVIIGRNNAGDWWRVCCVEGEPGWLFAQAVTTTGDVSLAPLSPAPPTPSPSATPAPAP